MNTANNVSVSGVSGSSNTRGFFWKCYYCGEESMEVRIGQRYSSGLATRDTALVAVAQMSERHANSRDENHQPVIFQRSEETETTTRIVDRTVE